MRILFVVPAYLLLVAALSFTILESTSIHLLSAFIMTIVMIILKPFPMGAVAFFSVSYCLTFKLITLNEALSGFASPVVWLVLSAFFISKGMSKTGLGERLGLVFIYYFGKTPLSLAYSLTFAEVLIAPTIPSVTARSAGVIYPIITNLSKSLGSEPDQGESAQKIGQYLTLVTFQITVVTSAMFLTAMAANPLLASLTNQQVSGQVVTFSSWLKMSLVPGLLSCLIIPWFILKVSPPTLTSVKSVKQFADQKMSDMGPMSFKELVMMFVMIFLLIGWIFGDYFNVEAVTVALAGLSLLLLSGVLLWSDITMEKTAWDTFVWFSVLLMLATALKNHGVIDYGAQSLIALSSIFPTRVAIVLLMGFYFYSHYFFAMTTAHVTAMFLPFATTLYALSADPISVLWQLIFMSNLFGGLTHYSIGPAPILYAYGYVTLSTWWKVGFWVSLINLMIWCGLAPYWWSFISV